MKALATVAALSLLAVPAFAEGDAAKGEKGFKKCKSCHMIVSPEGETIVKGGKTGPGTPHLRSQDKQVFQRGLLYRRLHRYSVSSSRPRSYRSR